MQIILIEREPKAMNKIYISDRGKQHKRINDFLKRSRLPYEKRHLEYGDYQIEGKPIVIFVFESIQEFAAAVRDKKKDHFWKQVSRATGRDEKELFCLISDIVDDEQLLSEIKIMEKYPNAHVLFLDERDIAPLVFCILNQWFDSDPCSLLAAYGKKIRRQRKNDK